MTNVYAKAFTTLEVVARLGKTAKKLAVTPEDALDLATFDALWNEEHVNRFDYYSSELERTLRVGSLLPVAPRLLWPELAQRWAGARQSLAATMQAANQALDAVNHAFQNLYRRHYADWIQRSDAPAVFTHQFLERILKAYWDTQGKRKAVILVFDGMALVFIEREQLACLARQVGDVAAGLLEINTSVEVPKLIVSTQSATSFPQLDDGSIDYVFTDPPYAGKVQYGELNFVWESWMEFHTDWYEQEIIVNETRGIDDAEWAAMLRLAFQECYRVLKPGQWLSLCYHDTSEGTWGLVQDIMAEIGFVPETAGDTLYIDTGQKSINQITADKVTKRDLVINFRKPRPGETGAVVLTGDEDAATFGD